MGLKSKLKEARTRALMSGLIKFISARLTGLLAGIPLDRDSGEAEAVIMLSPGKKDTEIYIVALSIDRKISRVCKKYTAEELGSMLSGKMQAAGVDLGQMVQANMPEEPIDEPLNQEEV